MLVKNIQTPGNSFRELVQFNGEGLGCGGKRGIYATGEVAGISRGTGLWDCVQLARAGVLEDASPTQGLLGGGRGVRDLTRSNKERDLIIVRALNSY